jgi:molybdopterin/thiamine biosynthesis adenylyltransferase
MDLGKLAQSTVGVVGIGGSAGLVRDLARCGIGSFSLVDFDIVEAENVARQGHDADSVGTAKVKALAKSLKAVNPDVNISYVMADFCLLSDEMIDSQFADVDLLIFATDRFEAQARGNEVALRLRKPAISIGLYRQGLAGEIIFWHPEIDACYRCLCPKRYEVQAAARDAGESLDPPSDGATIFDVHFLDSIAGMLALGLLTRGTDNRFGRLIEQLGDRNFIQVKIDPTWTLRGRDVVRDQLGIADDCPAYFAWNAIVRSDPDNGQLPCPDCAKFRGHRFDELSGTPVRIKDTTQTARPALADTTDVCDAEVEIETV